MNNIYQTPLYESALLYATRYNLPVFPSSKEKAPLIQDWYHRATKEPHAIEKWWTNWPDANVSLPTGSASGIIVLDVDVKAGQSGFESLRELETKYGELPKTPSSLSPSGGQHFFFKYSGPSIGRRIRFMPGLDLMAESSNVLLPPSSGKNGRAYTWEVSGRIDEVPFADLPQWLTGVVCAGSSNQDGVSNSKNSSWRRLAVEGVREGNRNQSVAQLAGYLLRRFVDPYLVLELIHLWNKGRNHPPLPDDEVTRTVNSIAGKEFRRRNGGGK